MSVSANPVLHANKLNRKLSENASVQNLSLSLHRGDVLGLLGLNGAGKSTILRMLSGTLVPDSGAVSINGFSLSEQPLQARQHLGYLPDQPPLFNDMRVTDYITLCAKLRRVKVATLHQRVSDVLTQCDLHGMKDKRISQLSKGFRQRVGLAQAIVHEPSVLLLDEPSNGLDPNQMQGMRDIISSVGEKHAVIFSTHLLNEAQAVCNRIAMVHGGKLLHDNAVTNDNGQLEKLFESLTREKPETVEA